MIYAQCMSIQSKNRYKCSSCSGKSKAYGRNRSGTKRYRCLECGKTFSSFQKKVQQKINYLKLLEEYILYGVTYRYLGKIYRVDKRTLMRKFHELLEKEPPILVVPETKNEESYLIIDGKWTRKTEVMMIYRRSDTREILHISFLRKEYGSQIARDLGYLKSLGYKFTCVVSDGGTGIRKAVRKVFGGIPHQICMAHMHRMATLCLGKYPKDERVKQLKKLADHIWLLESPEARIWWVNELKTWGKVNWNYLVERRRDDLGRVWFAHKNARKSLKILLSASRHSFAFLSHPLLPKTSNHIEATIGVLGDKKKNSSRFEAKQKPRIYEMVCLLLQPKLHILRTFYSGPFPQRVLSI